MGRMTRFMNQTCEFQQAKRTASGSVKLNRYGEVDYNEPVSIKCRLERTTKDVLTANGSAIKSASIYYTDEKVIIKPDDKLGGNVVLSVEEYVDGLGRVIGYKSYA